MGGVEAGFLAERQEGVAAGAFAAFQFAEDQTHEGAGLADQAGFGDGRADLGDSAHHGPGAQNGDQAFGGVDAVLKGDHGGGWADQGLDGLASGFYVPELDAEQNEIDRADAARVVGRPRRVDQGFAASAFYPEAVFAYCLQVGAAGDEGYVGTGFGQGGPEGAADSAGTDDGYAHGSNSVSFLGIRS